MVAVYSAKKACWMSDLSFDDDAFLNFQVETSLSSSEPPVYWSSIPDETGHGPAPSVTNAVRVETVGVGKAVLAAAVATLQFVPAVFNASTTANFAQMLSASSVDDVKPGMGGVELTPCCAFPSSSNTPM